MKNKLMIGYWRYILDMPPFLWEKQVAKAKKNFEAELGSISAEHRLVHHLAVRELPYTGKPLSPGSIASKSGLPVELVKSILDDLDGRLKILYRNGAGEVVWAYPVTVDKTPHHVTFSTGEQIYAA